MSLTWKQKVRLLVSDFREIRRLRRSTTPEAAEARRRDPNRFRNFYLFREPVVYLPIALGGLIASFAPLDVMDHMPQALKTLAHWLRGIYLPMDGYIRRSAFPQVTELYFTLMVLHAPLHFWFMRAEMWSPYNRNAVRQKWKSFGTASKVLGLIGMFLAMTVSVMGFVLSAGWDFSLFPINRSRAVLALFGWVFSAGGAFMTVAFFSSWFAIVLSRSNER